MPRPPILPTLGWEAIWNSGKDYGAWLKEAEKPDHREQMEQARAALPVDRKTEAWLQALGKPVHVAAFAEDWCPDVVRHVPVLQRFACITEHLRVRFFKREEQPEVFSRFLTNGGEALPVFVFLSAAFVECGNWGPMPASCKEMIARGKASGDGARARELVAAAYAADPECLVVQRDFCRLIDIASSATPSSASL